MKKLLTSVAVALALAGVADADDDLNNSDPRWNMPELKDVTVLRDA
jgi:hypothetical protein